MIRTNRAVIVQCRLSSTRLPGKALMDLGGKPVLAWCLNSMKKIKADKYFVATDEASFDKLKPVCEEYGFQCYAGSLEDVLNRFCNLIRTINVKTVIRATADNPFLFYEAAEESVVEFEKLNKGKLHCDYLTFSGLPHGSGVEIINADSLLKAESETDLPYDHEHVGPALYNHKDKYRCEFIKAPHRYNFPGLRTTIDTYSDYLRACQIVNLLGAENAPYTTEQIVQACNSEIVKNPLVLVPSVVKGQGTGHLHRCLNTALNKPFFVFIPQDKTLKEADEIISEYKKKGIKEYQIINNLPDSTYSPVIVTDLFKMTKEQAEKLSSLKSLISIDEGSEYSEYCDCLLDIIPSVDLKRRANFSETGFISRPKNIHSGTDINTISKILVCLGGEDPSGLTIPAVNAIKSCYENAKITAVYSGEELANYSNENINFVKNIPDLKEQLFNYDLVITHYGLTAFEAMYAGCAVILLPTTKLHKKLAEKYNFAYVDDEKVSTESMLRALSSENLINKKLQKSDCQHLSDYLESVTQGKRMLCPVCGKSQRIPDAVISRNATRTYRRCQSCGLAYMAWSIEEDKKYKKSYFFEDYKKQYGKTYQEDFESIKKQGLRRMSVINSLCLTVKDKSVLDIGCAYGPFLAAANDFKARPFGTDISSDAVDFVQRELRYPSSCADFPAFEPSSEFGVSQFDIVTMWYVIEHFKNLDEVLRKVNMILKKGGIFAFSTPSGEGISATSNKDYFYQISPTDHYSIWEPSKAAKILKKYGFEVVKIVSTGHHPERFPGNPKSSFHKNILNLISKTCKLGDTCEIYCRKIK